MAQRDPELTPSGVAPSGITKRVTSAAPPPKKLNTQRSHSCRAHDERLEVRMASRFDGILSALGRAQEPAALARATGLSIGSLLLALSCSGSPQKSPRVQESQAVRHSPRAAMPANAVAGALKEAAPRGSAEARALRARGPEGLATLLATAGRNPGPDARRLIDTVAGQLDADVSRLYWHTDFNAALAQSQEQKKPILSLRLLGRLDDELSCANSRLFRTTLYPDARVSRLLREGFVLHWTSERKVPRITIDYGDGRTLERTITGNSIHYVMDSQGRVVDALPGLYGARAFTRALEHLRGVARGASNLEGAAWSRFVRAHHRRALRKTRSQLTASLRAIGLAPTAVPQLARPRGKTAAPSAKRAVPIAVTKAVIERPVIQRTVPTFTELERRIDTDAVWARLAKLDVNKVVLDPGARKVIARKGPITWSNGDGRVQKAAGEDLKRMLRLLEDHIAQDTMKNELMLRRRIHQWLANEPMNFADLNRRVYADLFLTPASDPWLGLLPRDVFSALPGGGVRAQP